MQLSCGADTLGAPRKGCGCASYLAGRYLLGNTSASSPSVCSVTFVSLLFGFLTSCAALQAAEFNRFSCPSLHCSAISALSRAEVLRTSLLLHFPSDPPLPLVLSSCASRTFLALCAETWELVCLLRTQQSLQQSLTAFSLLSTLSSAG